MLARKEGRAGLRGQLTEEVDSDEGSHRDKELRKSLKYQDLTKTRLEKPAFPMECVDLVMKISLILQLFIY